MLCDNSVNAAIADSPFAPSLHCWGLKWKGRSPIEARAL